jgi:tripartite-type tricarboxylate transporter receptor subunit TctC
MRKNFVIKEHILSFCENNINAYHALTVPPTASTTMKKLSKVVLGVTTMAVISLAGMHANAQATFPDRAVTITNSTAAGGGVDTTSRTMGKVLSEMWKQPVLTQNSPGGGGIIAANQVIKSAPNGYELLLGHSGDISATPFLFDRPDYQPLKQLTPISQVLFQPYAVLVHPSVPANNLAELIAWIKKKNSEGEEVGAATGALGGPEHLSAGKLAQAAGLNLMIIPFRSAGPALLDVVAGRVPFGFFSIATGGAQVKAGALRMLAIGSDKRVDNFPDIPTVSETLPGFTAYAYYGIFGPAGMSSELAQRISKDIHAAVASPEMQTLMRNNGQIPAVSSPTEFAQFLQKDALETQEQIKKSGIKLN